MILSIRHQSSSFIFQISSFITQILGNIFQNYNLTKLINSLHIVLLAGVKLCYMTSFFCHVVNCLEIHDLHYLLWNLLIYLCWPAWASLTYAVSLLSLMREIYFLIIWYGPALYDLNLLQLPGTVSSLKTFFHLVSLNTLLNF